MVIFLAAAGPSMLATLDVAIGGPANAGENEDCTYVASSDGTPPHTFSWKRDGQFVSSDSVYETNTGTSDFFLRLDVTDANQDTGFDTLTVDVISGGGPCFD